MTPEQRAAVDQARAALVSPAPASMYELSDTAARIRELERHLDAVLRVIDQIVGEAQ